MVSRNPLHVLFVEPELAANRPLRMELRRRGALVDLAESAADALRRVDAGPPDLVVLDDALRMDGETDLLRHLTVRAPETEIVLLYSDSDSAPHGPGLGLLFSAHKPVSRQALLEVIDEGFPGRLSAPAGRAAARTVLCVDDDLRYLNSMARQLNRRGYRVVARENSERTLEDLESIRPELAIVDIMMPGRDGLELVRDLRERSGGRIPIIVLTGLDSDETYYRAIESGASSCLLKTGGEDEFLNAVDLHAGSLDDQERALIQARRDAEAQAPPT